MPSCHLLVVCNYYCCNGVLIVDGVCVSVLCCCSHKDYSQSAPLGPDSGLMLREPQASQAILLSKGEDLEGES